MINFILGVLMGYFLTLFRLEDYYFFMKKIRDRLEGKK